MVTTTSSNAAPFAVGASVRATIAASPEDLWAWIADPTRHPQMAGSGEPQAIEMIDAMPTGVGSRFESQQKMFGLIRYVSRSEIVVFEPYHRFRFCVQDHALWDFLLEPVDGGTQVTHRHRLDLSASLRLLAPIIRQRTRQNANNMARTLQNLARLVGAPAPTQIQVSYQPPLLN
jgi:hypothetical protein